MLVMGCPGYERSRGVRLGRGVGGVSGGVGGGTRFLCEKKTTALIFLKWIVEFFSISNWGENFFWLGRDFDLGKNLIGWQREKFNNS